jgi:hypothetical protein
MGARNNQYMSFIELVYASIDKLSIKTTSHVKIKTVIIA